MKVYSRPEVLEDHIAPALVIPGSDIGVFVGNNNAGIEIQGNNTAINPALIITPAIFESRFVGGDLAPQPESLSSASDFSEFKIRTVTIGTDSSLFSGKRPEIDFQKVLFQALIGNTSFSSSLTEATASILANELGSTDSIIDAIDSAVGGDRSTELVGLSSEEFERIGGAAFLTKI
jgi:hypothetical protein